MHCFQIRLCLHWRQHSTLIAANAGKSDWIKLESNPNEIVLLSNLTALHKCPLKGCMLHLSELLFLVHKEADCTKPSLTAGRPCSD